MTTPEPPAPQPAPTAAPLADWGTRAIGFLIDYLPILLLNVLTFWSDFLSWIAWLISIGYIIYLGNMEGTTGQTPGKTVQGIRLVNGQGELIGSGPGIGRKFAHIVDSLVCMLGWFLPLVDDKRQTIADKLLETYVVTGAEKKPFAVELWMPQQQQTPPPPPPQAPPSDTPPPEAPPES
ncbi:MAG: RDD family protein [Acidimicrobiia bacterium]